MAAQGSPPLSSIKSTSTPSPAERPSSPPAARHANSAARAVETFSNKNPEIRRVPKHISPSRERFYGIGRTMLSTLKGTTTKAKTKTQYSTNQETSVKRDANPEKETLKASIKQLCTPSFFELDDKKLDNASLKDLERLKQVLSFEKKAETDPLLAELKQELQSTDKTVSLLVEYKNERGIPTTCREIDPEPDAGNGKYEKKHELIENPKYRELIDTIQQYESLIKKNRRFISTFTSPMITSEDAAESA